MPMRRSSSPKLDPWRSGATPGCPGACCPAGPSRMPKAASSCAPVCRVRLPKAPPPPSCSSQAEGRKSPSTMESACDARRRPSWRRADRAMHVPAPMRPQKTPAVAAGPTQLRRDRNMSNAPCAAPASARLPR
eukprot:7618531-Alexandrium_andersonii.AAC.1